MSRRCGQFPLHNYMYIKETLKTIQGQDPSCLKKNHFHLSAFHSYIWLNVFVDIVFQFLPVPELLPFRLTRQLRNLMMPLTVKGLIESTMIHTLRALRSDSDLLLNTMDIFVKEPSLDWLVSREKCQILPLVKLNSFYVLHSSPFLSCLPSTFQL